MRQVKDDRNFWVYLGLTVGTYVIFPFILGIFLGIWGNVLGFALAFITCKIYQIVFWWNLVEDLNTVCEPIEGPDSDQKSLNSIIVFLISAVTCNIYYYFWLYNQGNRTQNIGKHYGLDINENGTSLLLWSIIGMVFCGVGPLFAQYYFVTNINKLCQASNRSDGVTPKPPVDVVYPPIGGQKPSSGTLNFVAGEKQGFSISLPDGNSIVIGRDPSSVNIHLTEKDISRRHCKIEYSASEKCYYITDYSSYGVYVNGQQIQKNIRLRCNTGSNVSLAGGKNQFILR